MIVSQRDALDLADLPDLDPLRTEERIAAVINCGAYIAVDNAESEPDLAFAINAEAPGLPLRPRGRASLSSSWRAITSSAAVKVRGARTTRSRRRASTPEARRQCAIRAYATRSCGPRGWCRRREQFAEDNAAAGRRARQFASRYRPARRADTCRRSRPSGRDGCGNFVADRDHPSGTWHCTNAGETTWHGLAEHVFACAARHALPVPRGVGAIATVEYPIPAKRPPDSQLDTSKLARDFSVRLRPWQEAVEEIVATLAAPAWSSSSSAP